MPTQTGTIPTLGRMLGGRRILVATAMVAAAVMYSPSVLHLARPVAASPVPHLAGASGHAVGSGEAQGAAPMLVPGPIGPTVAAIAGARVNASGTVLTWFNDYGGAPQVTHTAGSGLYFVEFPNAPVLGQYTGGNSILSVTPDTPSGDCTVVNADYANSGAIAASAATSVIFVFTKDCTDSFADRGFHLVVLGSPPTSTTSGASPIAAIAGARLSASGAVLDSFNDYGGAPQVTHTAGSGLYLRRVPGSPRSSAMVATASCPSRRTRLRPTARR